MSQTPELPLDIRLLNALATGLYALGALLLTVMWLVWWTARPSFDVRAVRVQGDVTHYNAITMRANVLPHLQGTFFTLDLQAAQRAFEALPWVRQAQVSRDFPNRLRVQLQEHQTVAFWGEEGQPRLVNSFGEVFDANLGELEQEDLPRLNGPLAQSAQILAMYHSLQRLLQPHELSVQQLELTARGGWRAELDTGTQLELGTGDSAEVLARAERFLKTVTQVAARYQRTPQQLAAVDLRHVDGYALRLQGVMTLGEGKGQ